MDGERKRKRAAKVDVSSSDDQIKGKGRDAVAEEEEGAAPPPTEEEVEEFFAILRRMRVAVKYFEKEGFNGKSGGDEPQSSTPAEAVADGATVAGKRLTEIGGLDLNTVPESESSVV